ncbi:MAG: hypothetical protein KAJ23_17335 [Maribacter sp.]|nr:hypothetical protein [Maribacter sp.]
MEQIEGDDGFSCFGAVVGIIAIATMATPVGWVAWGVFIATGMSTGFSLGDCTYDLAH